MAALEIRFLLPLWFLLVLDVVVEWLFELILEFYILCYAELVNSDYFVNLVVFKHSEQLTPLYFALSVYKSGWYTHERKAILVFPEHALSLTCFAF